MEHYIGQKVYRPGKIILQYGCIIDRIGLRGIGVEVTANALQTVYHVKGRTTGSALKCRVLAEMGYSLIAFRLVGGARIDFITAIDDRR